MKPIDRKEYVVLCQARWHGVHLADARRNFADFEEIRDQLEPNLRAYARDPWLKNIVGVCLNPDGTLSAMLWKLQTAIEPNQSCLYPLLDFEEHWQKVFLRRGLLIYCQLMLREIQTVNVPDDATMELPMK